MKTKQQKQGERQLEMSAYMQALVTKRMSNDKNIKGFKLLDNGAVKFYYSDKAPRSQVNKALGCNLGESLRSMNSVRVCHNMKG